MRLIDADTLKAAINSRTMWCNLLLESNEVLDIIDKQPDAEPVRRGNWLECEDGWGDTHYQCSECGAEWNLDAGTPSENNMNYCPECGARMEMGD